MINSRICQQYSVSWTILSFLMSMGRGLLGLSPPSTGRSSLPVGLSFEAEGKRHNTALTTLREHWPSSRNVGISDRIVLLFSMFPELLVGLKFKERLLLLKSELPRPLGSYLAKQSQSLISKDKVEFALFPRLRNMRILSNLFISHRSKIQADFIFLKQGLWATLEHLILLPQFLECWDHRYTPLRPSPTSLFFYNPYSFL